MVSNTRKQKNRLHQVLVRHQNQSKHTIRRSVNSIRTSNLSKPNVKQTLKDIMSGNRLPFIYVLSFMVIAVTGGVCFWILKYSALDVYDQNNYHETAYSTQVNQLLLGERLHPPPAPPEELFEELDAEIASYQAAQVEDGFWASGDNDTLIDVGPAGYASSTDQSSSEQYSAAASMTSSDLPTSDMLMAHLNHGYINVKNADRNWKKMNSEFVQRLLTVYKIMHDQYGYDMVLLEGYRSPERQARLLSKGSHVTKAGSYRSYHQFGLAADSAFIRNGKIVISEKDPWAMRGYKLYGKVSKSVGLVWGGDWRMKDLGHVELRKKGVLGRPEMAKILTNQ